MNKLLISTVVAVSLSMSVANASVINGIDYGDGLTVETGSIWFSTTDTGLVSGVGTVDAIRDGEGDIVWLYGDNNVEYNYLFTDVLVDYRDDTLTGFVYGDTGGVFDFYSNDMGTFQATGDWDADSALISLGDLNLTAEGYMVDYGGGDWTIVGSGTSLANTGTGNIFFTGGDALELIVQDAILTVDGSFTDASFNFSTDGLFEDASGYERSGSVDMKMNVVDVPEPSGLVLMGLGLIGMVGARKLKM